ncbi:MAG TPA: response regulator [Reyranella sp.]|nr:response regulator [Reyranella sp.]
MPDMPADAGHLLQRFIAGLGDVAVVLLDPQGDVVSWNAGATSLLGYTAQDVIGRNFAELHGKLDLKGAAQSGRHEAIGQFPTKAGGTRQVRVLLSPLAEPGRGLLGFGLLILDAAGPASAATAAAATAPPARRKSKILVVDDNPGLLEEAVDMLARMGFAVRSASNGADALAILQHETDIDLLFTDVVMPGEIAGRLLAERALLLKPGLRVLFASGYFEGALVSKGELKDNVQFIAKPYRMRELAQKLEQVLSAR